VPCSWTRKAAIIRKEIIVDLVIILGILGIWVVLFYF